jgi:hypothetical protein
VPASSAWSFAEPDQVHLLGDVDEQEEERERARDGLLHRRRPRFDEGEQRADRGGVVLAAPVAARSAEPLDRVEGGVAFEALHGASETRREPAHVVVERCVLRASGRLGQIRHAAG